MGTGVPVCKIACPGKGEWERSPAFGDFRTPGNVLTILKKKSDSGEGGRSGEIRLHNRRKACHMLHTDRVDRAAGYRESGQRGRPDRLPCSSLKGRLDGYGEAHSCWCGQTSRRTRSFGPSPRMFLFLCCRRAEPLDQLISCEHHIELDKDHRQSGD